MQYKLIKRLVALAFSIAAGVASAATMVNKTSNVIFIVDGSGSMSTEHDFLKSVITDLDADLATAGVTNRSYGLVGFGRTSTLGGPEPSTICADAPALSDAATTKTNHNSLVANGGTEDGYSAINFALSAFNYTSGAAVNFVLVTDEDRDVLAGAGGLTATSITNALKNATSC